MMCSEREDWTTRAEIAYAARRYDDMWLYMRGLVQCVSAKRKLEQDSTPHYTAEQSSLLTEDERQLLATALRRVLLSRRDAARVCYETAQRCHTAITDSEQLLVVQAHKMKFELETEMEIIVDAYSTMMDRHILPKYTAVRASNVDDATFYYLLKADCYRYMCEMATGMSRQRYAANCLAFYRTTMDYGMCYFGVLCHSSASHLPPANPLRLSTSLNIMVFYMEILDKRAAACRLGLAAVVNAKCSVFCDDDNADDAVHTIIDNVRLWYQRDEKLAEIELGQLYPYLTREKSNGMAEAHVSASSSNETVTI